MKDISVITVNYKTPELTKQCIESVLQQRGLDVPRAGAGSIGRVSFEVIVVDNNSGDNSIDVLQKFGEQIIFIANKENLGFGKANNQGFKHSTSRYLFLLNPDARLLSQNDLARAVKYMDEHPQYGLVGTRIVDSQNHFQNTISDHYPRQKQSGRDFSHLPGKWACVLGASMVIRRKVFEMVNGFDEDYFLYAEETDLCLRIREAGFEIGYLEDVTVSHVGGASAKILPSEQTIRRKKSAKYIFYKKHYPKQSVINMAKKDLRQAKWQAFFLRLKKKLFGLTEKQKHKLARHEIAIEIAGDFLQEFK